MAEPSWIATGDDPVVPLDAGDQADAREVGAAHEGDALGIARVEQIRLGVEALLMGLEGPQVYLVGVVLGQVEEATERPRLGGVEVVAGEETQAPAAL